MQLYWYCNILISVSYHFLSTLSFLSWSYFETLNNPIILRLFKSVCTFHIYNSCPYTYYISTTYISFSSTLRCNPFKILYKTPNKPYKGMYKFLNFDLASPSIDHSIKFSDSLCSPKGISIEVLLNICVSTFLRVIHLNVYTISTICDIL